MQEEAAFQSGERGQERLRRLFGCWHNKPGADKKLICWGWTESEFPHSEVIRAFKQAFPRKNIQNLVLTESYTIEEYQDIAQAQADAGFKV